ncbi:type II toxin-antitoxin system PemK/MazF family toxin [Poseidonibacter sp.]|uniref:type II toxin-antitoxin system PemK/MazF family toxin n=1 Tax=Poseidonibacter sp. TaxID=2321188 RepID=UPI003C77614C
MKNYDKWNEVKKEASNQSNYFTFKVREIYWLKVGYNIGYEVYGKGDDYLRPVLILRKFSKESFLGIPLTSSIKDNIFHYGFTPINKEKKNYAMLSQIKLFSSKRIHDKMGKISVEDFEKLKNNLKELIGL